jgi:carboxylesterase type B
MEELLQVSLAVSLKDGPPEFNGLEVFSTVVDGDFIPVAPSILFKTGGFFDIPLIIGWNSDDASRFVPTNTQAEADVVNDMHQIFPRFTNSTLTHILELYPSSDFMAEPAENVTAQFAKLLRVAQNIEFTCPSLRCPHCELSAKSRVRTNLSYLIQVSRDSVAANP